VKKLHDIPRFEDRWSHLYLECGKLDVTAKAVVFENAAGHFPVPIDQLGLLILGPGTTLTHAAASALAANSCMVTWSGTEGDKMYAHSTGTTFSARRLILQARLVSDESQRLAVARRMYQKRFPEDDLSDLTIEQIRGMEGQRVRRFYSEAATAHGVMWRRREYDQSKWDHADPMNRSLSVANACLYGLVHAGIVAAGYSAGLGFIHTGKMLSFVYDVADFYKTEVSIPVAFETVGESKQDVEKRTRIAMRQKCWEVKVMKRLLPDIAEVLGAPDDCRESSTDLEGRAVSMAAPDLPRGVPGKPNDTSA
jgi:CRISPR-associated protein Cas1